MVDLKADNIVQRLSKRPRDRLKPERKPTQPSQSLSAIEAIDHRVIPPTYRNQYERLKQRDPAKAQEFWDKWAFDPRPKPRDPYKLEKRVLSRV